MACAWNESGLLQVNVQSVPPAADGHSSRCSQLAGGVEEMND
jgi:hypothetical protein